MTVLSWPAHLRVVEVDSAKNEYRIRQGQLEVRKLEGRRTSGSGDGWTAITPEEIRRHFALNSPVAQWLRKRMRASNRLA